MGRDSVVGMATRLRTRRCGVRTPMGASDFIFSTPLPDRLFGPTSVLYDRHQSSFTVVKRSSPLVDHPTPFRAPLCLHSYWWRLLLLTFTHSIRRCWTQVPLEMQKENYPSPQIYVRFEIVLVGTGSVLSMDAACSSKRPCTSISNCTLLQLIRTQYWSLKLTNK